MATPHGQVTFEVLGFEPFTPSRTGLIQAFESCTCTEREDQLCIHLRNNILDACSKPTPPPPAPGDNSVTLSPTDFIGDGQTSSAQIFFPSLLLCALLTIRLYFSMF
ncbi:hypothetical protein TELCIR_22105 [Teladorsagia circumcincta]|uniref:Uncharacterized protein n=1 Tax=Teladorsagia circumcincta TaxID=45464 RepID=A0A2G9TEW9_TELCI|nr:hypothetical protein TELCIR_22105 [Teladorsagia circumcincta]